MAGLVDADGDDVDTGTSRLVVSVLIRLLVPTVMVLVTTCSTVLLAGGPLGLVGRFEPRVCPSVTVLGCVSAAVGDVNSFVVVSPACSEASVVVGLLVVCISITVDVGLEAAADDGSDGGVRDVPAGLAAVEVGVAEFGDAPVPTGTFWRYCRALSISFAETEANVFRRRMNRHDKVGLKTIVWICSSNKVKDC